MSNEEVANTMQAGNEGVGARLRAAREAAGKSLEQISADTRVSVRHLDALEREAIDELPRGPYASGFARSYAKALGLDQAGVSDAVKQLQQHSGAGLTAALDVYEPADAKRVPPKALAWTAGLIFVLLVVGYLVWRSSIMTPDFGANGGEPVVAASEDQPVAATPAGTPAAPTAFAETEVVRLSASGPVWFSLENAEGRSQFDLTLQAGEFYTVKPEQRGLLLRTGRPQALRILVGERTMPQLGADDTIVSKIGLDGASLARLAASPPTLDASVIPTAPPPLTVPPAAR